MTTDVNTGARVLIVDDIPDTVQLLRDWLESHHYRTIGATSSLDALGIAAEQQPDLILLDVMMPRMDGMETCRRLKADPRTAGIPVILVTAKNPSDARAEGMMAGAVDYITKPINLQDLIGRIEAALTKNTQSPVEVQRLLEEVVHSALTILPSELVWLLGLDTEEHVLKSRILATSAGTRTENEFLLMAGRGDPSPKFTLNNQVHPFITPLTTRLTKFNLPTEALKESPETLDLYRATEMLRLSYLTIVPLTAASKTPGVMVLGSYQPHNMEAPRATQILSSLGRQAAIALDYSRVIIDLTQRDADMRREQAFRQMILDTMSDGLVVIDSKGAVKYVNRRLLRMTNYPKGYLEGRSVGDLFHPDDRMEIMTGLLREGAATLRFDQRLMTKENKVMPVWLSRSRAQSDDLTNQVIVLSDMTEQKQREVELERNTGRLEALNRAAHAITSNLSLHETLNNILASATDVVEAQGASLFLFNKDNLNELIAVAAVGSGANVIQGLRVPVGEGVAGWVAREAKSQLVKNIHDDPRFYRGVDEQTGMNTQSLIAVPLITAEQVIGVLEVVNKLNQRAFDEDDMRLLESMAGTAAVSVANARLFDESQRRVNELGTLLNASAAASATLQFPSVLENIARNLSAGLEVARCMIMSWNGTQRRLVPLAEVCDVFWKSEDAPQRPLSAEPLMRAALSSGLHIMASRTDSHLSEDERDTLDASGMAQMMVVPLWVNNQIGGLASLYSGDTDRPYDDGDAEQVGFVVGAWQQSLPEGTTLASADETAIKNLSDYLMDIAETSWVALRLWHTGEDFTHIIREKGFAEWTARSGTPLAIEQYPTMRDVIENRVVKMGTLESLAHDPAETEWMRFRGGQSCLIVPLVLHSTTIGMVKMIARYERRFDSAEVRLAQGIANVVSSAMENARLYQSLETRAQALASAYNELQEADRAKDDFIQNVSHELRTPLIAVLGYAGLLAEGEFGMIKDNQREAVDIIVDKAQKLAHIVQDIVSLQALEAKDLNLKALDMAALVQEVLEKQAHQIQESGIRISTAIPADLPQVFGDAVVISEALEKLLDNALKFGNQGEKIEIELVDTGGPMVEVRIRDYGIGIDPAEQEKIFQKFYQVDSGPARHYAGTGLGLARVKAVIEGHGGRVGVSSQLGEGASFYFTIPKYSTMTNGTS